MKLDAASTLHKSANAQRSFIPLTLNNDLPIGANNSLSQDINLKLSPVAVCSGSVAVPAEAWSGPGAELGPGGTFRVTDVGVGREAFSGEGMGALRPARGLMGVLELLEQLSGLSSIFTVLLTQDSEEEPP